MYLFRTCINYKSIKTFVRRYSLARKNHYDVLRLRKNCSDKQIKEAFIQMSKEYHPDKNKDAKAQEKFVRIVEAYNVLGKPSSRAQYDRLTQIPTSYSSPQYSYVYRPAPYNVRNPDYNFYYEPPKYKSYDNTSQNSEKTARNQWYYGFAGLKKLPNYYIIAICIGFAFIGVLLQLYVIRNMYVAQRSAALERSKRLAQELEKVRATATDNGNELQTRLLLEKIVSASNPTVTTASLGQALAEEKRDNIDHLLEEFGISDSPEAWYETYDGVNERWDWDDLRYFESRRVG